MNRAVLPAFALLCFSLVACTGETAEDDDPADAEVTARTEITPQEVAQKKPTKPKEQQPYLIIKMEDVLVSSY